MSSSVPSAELESIIKKLILYKNPFDALDIPEDATVEDAQKRYKRIALAVHPDKCTHEKALDAFTAAKKALKTIENEEARTFYLDMIKLAKEKVSDDPKTAKLVGSEYEFEVKKMTQKLLIEFEVQAKRAEEYKLANEKREKEQKLKEAEEKKREEEEQAKWDERRLERVESWRKVVDKKTESKASTPSTSTPAPTDAKKPAAPGLDKPTKTIKKKYIPKPLKPPKLKLTR